MRYCGWQMLLSSEYLGMFCFISIWVASFAMLAYTSRKVETAENIISCKWVLTWHTRDIRVYVCVYHLVAYHSWQQLILFSSPYINSHTNTLVFTILGVLVLEPLVQYWSNHPMSTSLSIISVLASYIHAIDTPVMSLICICAHLHGSTEHRLFKFFYDDLLLNMFRKMYFKKTW